MVTGLGGLIVSALDPELSGLYSTPRLGHCIVLLDKKRYSHSASPSRVI